MYSVREWFQIRCRARLLKGEAMLPREGGGETKHYVFVVLCGSSLLKWCLAVQIVWSSV